MQLLRELFGNTTRAAGILGVDGALRRELAERRALLAPNQIGPDGRLQEWLESYPEPEPTHRPTSHPYGLPADQRRTFLTGQTVDGNAALAPAGFLGPARLRASRAIELH